MRTGQNPAKSIEYVTQPSRVTVAVITYIPFLSGYYASSLDVLKMCLGSIWANSDMNYDLQVFDNASCQEVQDFLLKAHQEGRIQFLTLSENNIGKAGAWNFIFGSAQGDYIAYSDSDIYHNPGWLSAMLDILDTFPEVGMVTGIPMWSPVEYSTSTISWAKENPDARLEHGKLLSWEDYWKHASTLGHIQEKAKAHFDTCEEYKVEYQGVKCFIGAGHFQFIAPRKALQSVLPIPSDRPMGQVRRLDSALNDKGFLRLSTDSWFVRHMGNSLPPELSREGLESLNIPAPSPRNGATLWSFPVVRRFLQWSHGKTFDILYRN